MLRICVIALCLSGCATARPQSPEPITPERGVVPSTPPAPIEHITGTEGPVDRLHPTDPAVLAPIDPLAPTPSLPTPLTPALALAQVQEACTTGPMSRCQDAVTTAATLELTPEDRTRLSFEEGRVAAWLAVDRNAIGILLPLSGPYAKFGETAKEAIELALQETPSLRVVVRDTEGDADKAAAAATDLILRERVAVILGPIGRKESGAVATITRFYEVPLVPLTSELAPAAVLPTFIPPLDPAIAAPALDPAAPSEPLLVSAPDSVLRLRTSPSELVAAVARHARLELGITRAAILTPDTELGREAALAFRTELELLGATIVREVVFDPNAKDLTDAVKTLVALDSLPPKKRKPLKIKPDFEALFVPGDALLLRKLLPFLTYWGVKPRLSPGDKSRVQLLGTSGWNHPTIIDKGERLTENAVFADVFAPDDPDAQDFARRFFLRLQRRPTPFHAEVWDATRLAVDGVMTLPRDPMVPVSRLMVRDGFRSQRMLIGATGAIEVLPGGRVLPRPHLMTIEGELIRRRFSEEEERAMRSPLPPPEDPR